MQFFHITDYKAMALPEPLDRALAFVAANLEDLRAKEPGSYELEGRSIYYNIDAVSTKNLANCKAEGHRRYIDIQINLMGGESMGCKPLRPHMVPTEAYEDRDCYFYGTGDEDQAMLHCPPDYVAIFFPQDIHRPLIAGPEGPKAIKKLIVKVDVDLLGGAHGR